MPIKESTSSDTLRKALAININPSIYGTFAEIGAGQETARFFFRAGGAAGTIAKSMSAYDMAFSDAIYGSESSGRYVSKSRLEKMLDREFTLIVERLQSVRSAESTYFAYANTVAAQGYKKRSECHGWIGIRAQLHPAAQPSQIVTHVRMLDPSTQQQQLALGVFGVNLIHGTYHQFKDPLQLVSTLLDGLGSTRLEVDFIHFSGPQFESVDNRLMALQLVKQGMTHAVLFNERGEIELSAEYFYKRPILTVRGSYRPITNVHLDILENGRKHFLENGSIDPQRLATVVEITMAQLMVEGEIDTADFLARVDLVSACGYPVLISDYLRFFRLREYFNRYSTEPIRIALGIKNVLHIFQNSYYEGLEGGILEAFGKLFAGDIKLLIYPRLRSNGGVETADTVHVDRSLRLLFRYLRENQFIVPIQSYCHDYLSISPAQVLKSLTDPSKKEWEQHVPSVVADLIKENNYFNYQDS